MLERRKLFPEDAACAPPAVEPLFTEPDTYDQALAICQQCPVLEECQQQIGSLALGLYERQVESGVIAARAYDLGTEPKVSQTSYEEYIAPFPRDPHLALDRLRRTARDGFRVRSANNAALSAVITSIRSEYDLKVHPDYDDVITGKHYDDIWRTLIAALNTCGQSGIAVYRSDPELTADIGNLYAQDVTRLLGYGIDRARLLAIRYSPQYIQELKDRYRNHPLVYPSNINTVIGRNIPNIEKAVEAYVTKVGLFQQQYASDRYVTSLFIQTACLRGAASTFTHIERYRNNYKKLLASPKIGDYSDWLVQVAAVNGSKGHSFLKSMAKYRRPLSIDARRSDTGQNLEEKIASTAPGPEDQAINNAVPSDQQSDILYQLHSLPADEIKVVGHLFGLPWLLEKGEDTDQAEASLRQQLGVTDLSGYFQSRILPKLNSGDQLSA